MALFKVPEYGELYTIEEFAKLVRMGGITEDDGNGYWSDGVCYEDETSVFAEHSKRNTHVVWFNR